MSLAATLPVSAARRPESRTRLAILAGLLVVALGWAAWPGLAARLVYPARVRALIETLHDDPAIIAAVRDQNVALAGRDAAWAVAQDRIWGAEKAAGGGPFLDSVLAKPASQRLRELVAASGGIARHVIVMDASGRVAAVPIASYNFWQFPKPKFQNTFLRGPGARHVNRLEIGHDRSFVACWWSETLTDPNTGAAIGAFGVELDYGRVGEAICRPTP